MVNMTLKLCYRASLQLGAKIAFKEALAAFCVDQSQGTTRIRALSFLIAAINAVKKDTAEQRVLGLSKNLLSQGNFAASACFLCGRSTKMFRFMMVIVGCHASTRWETLEENCLHSRENVKFRSLNWSFLALLKVTIGSRSSNREFRECYRCLRASCLNPSNI
jgi:hypothetical protein